MIEQRIEAHLEALFQEEDFRDYFLIDINYQASREKVEVFLDGDSGISFSTCQAISRSLEKAIEEHKWLGEKYTLDVSSPGVGRPLKLRRQYPKNIGRKLELKLTDGSEASGTLLEVKEESILMEEKHRLKEGKKKKTITEQREYAFSDIDQAKVKISFK